MNITARTCANCTSFDPTAKDGYTCLAGVGIPARDPGRQNVYCSPAAGDCCDSHQTAVEAATHGL